jgi:hypothetical protein
MKRIICFLSFLVGVNFGLRVKISRQMKSLKLKHPLHRNNTHLKRSGVCLFLHTRLDVKKWDVNRTDKFSSYMRDVFLNSILRQCKDLTLCSSLKSFYLVITIQSYNHELGKFFEYVSRVTNLHLISPIDYPHSFREEVAQIIEQDNCEWLSNIWLDADDALLDGYFDYVTSDITKKLLTTTTPNGSAWRGAVFAPREMPRLIVGMNRCIVKHKDIALWSGHSQGMGFILRRDVWESMGKAIPRRGIHNKFLPKFRRYIMDKLKYDYEFCQSPYVKDKRWRKTKEQIACELKDATESRIMSIDIALTNKTGTLFVQTPFSSHFPWNQWENLPLCDYKQMEVIQREYPRDVKYFLEIARSVNMSIIGDVCMNKYYVRHHRSLCQGKSK